MIERRACNLRRTNCTISNEKFQFYIFESKTVGFVCNSNNESSEIIKIIKVFE